MEVSQKESFVNHTARLPNSSQVPGNSVGVKGYSSKNDKDGGTIIFNQGDVVQKYVKIDYKGFVKITLLSPQLQWSGTVWVQRYTRVLLQPTARWLRRGTKGIRENILKSRRFGFSSIIDAMFCADFILSELGAIPLTNSDVYSLQR